MSFVQAFRSLLIVASWSMLSSASSVWGCPNCKEGLLENGQTECGTVLLPEPLVPYMGGMRELTPD